METDVAEIPPVAGYISAEQDPETSLYDMGARYYDPWGGMFFGVDLLSDFYPSQSPYSYSYDNPERFIDPSGESGITTVSWQFGLNNTINYFLTTSVNGTRPAGIYSTGAMPMVWAGEKTSEWTESMNNQSGGITMLGRLIFSESAHYFLNQYTMPGIGWVVRNRVESRGMGFKNTYEGVITQKSGKYNEFNGYGDPLWKLAARTSGLSGKNMKAYIRAINVAIGVMGGTISDPTHRATYFNSNRIQKGWFKTELENGTLYPDEAIKGNVYPFHFYMQK